MWSLLLAAALQAPLDRILTHDDLRGASVGAIVTTLDGTVLYERNSDLRLMPASNQKLLSVSYALHALGPDFVPRLGFGGSPIESPSTRPAIRV